MGSDTRGTVLMIHGAFCASWCFDNFAEVFSARGFACEAPDLRHHQTGLEPQPDAEASVSSLNDYVSDIEGRIRKMDELPILIGHSMGGLIAQKLAAKGLARALILLSAAAPWGILPSTEDEIAAATGLMSAGPFWTHWLKPSFEVASGNALVKLDDKAKRAVFDKFCSESGQALFEMFFWMFDHGRAAAVDTAAVTCPVLMVFGSDDKVISARTGWQIAHRYGERATIHEAAGHGHMLLIEPGWERIAERCADWAARQADAKAKSLGRNRSRTKAKAKV